MVLARWLRRLEVMAVALATAGMLLACSGGGGDQARSSTTTRPVERTATPVWTIDGRADGVTIDTGAFHLEVATVDGLELTLTDPRGDVVVADATGLFVTRGDARHGIAATTETDIGLDHVLFDVAFDDGSTGTVELAAEGDHALGLRVTPDDVTGVTHWGTSFGLTDDELVYGLTERIVDDWLASEGIPQEVGSLDRRGEVVSMYVTPTMSGYLPWHQSSAGYGLLVDGFMPGEYDVGATVPDAITMEFELDPAEQAGTYHLVYGPDHDTILAGYYELAGYPRRPPDPVFLHWRGRDTYPVGVPAEYDGQPMNASVASDLDAYERYDLPAGVYHFDRPWAVGQEGYGTLEFDPERFPQAESMLDLMDELGWHQTVWVAPWAIGERGVEAKANGWLAPNSDRAIDLTNPEAVAWLQADLLEFLSSDEGRFIDGFFVDRGDEGDVTSTPDDVYADGRNGRQIHNWYPVEFSRILAAVMDDARSGDGWLIARPGYTGSQRYTARWGGDTRSREMLVAVPQDQAPDDAATAAVPSTDLGLRSVLISMQRAAFMGTPYWGSDIGGYTPWTDREVFARWIEVGFASPLMRFHGMGGTPWATTTSGRPDQDLIDIYRRYVVMRHDPVMQEYLVSAADEAATTGTPMVRPLVWAWPDESGSIDRWDEWMLGPDLLVAPVWRSGERRRSVWIPPGEWVDFWDRDVTVEGPTEITVDADLDELPMWVRPDSSLLELDVP